MHLPALSLPLVLGAALILSPRADAEIFKCGGRRNVPTYQNFPCEFDSLGAASAPSAGLPAPSVEPAAASNRLVQVAQHHVAPEAAPAPAQSAMPRVGMTGDDVRRIWGEPTFTTTEEHARKDIEVWSYGDSRSIEFDREQRVTAIRW